MWRVFLSRELPVLMWLERPRYVVGRHAGGSEEGARCGIAAGRKLPFQPLHIDFDEQ
jgi:hypothetical protein